MKLTPASHPPGPGKEALHWWHCWPFDPFFPNPMRLHLQIYKTFVTIIGCTLCEAELILGNLSHPSCLSGLHSTHPWPDSGRPGKLNCYLAQKSYYAMQPRKFVGPHKYLIIVLHSLRNSLLVASEAEHCSQVPQPTCFCNLWNLTLRAL